MSSNPLYDAYVKDLRGSEYDRLPKAEDIRLGKIKDTSLVDSEVADAKLRLLKSGLRYVTNVSKKYHSSGMDLPDIVQQGNLGLEIGVTRYDYRRNVCLITYVDYWIREQIRNGLDHQSRIVRLSRSFMERELANNPDGSSLPQTYSLDEESHPRIYAGPNPFESLAQKEWDKKFDALLDCLDGRERFIIEKRYGLGSDEKQTLREVGSELGLTKERIRQIQKAALCKLKTKGKIGIVLSLAS